MMDVTWARSLFTVICFVSFVLFLYVSLSRGSKQRYNDIAKEVIDDDDLPHDEPRSHSPQDHGAQ